MQRVLTAVVTPFIDDKVDMDSMENLIRFQIRNCCGVVLFGTTGECPTLTQEERKEIMEMVSKKFVNIDFDFVIGVGGNNTKECIENVNIAKEYGFTKFMITTPYYNKPTQLGMQKHFEEICKSSPESKFIIYNVPGRTNVNLLPNTVYNICKTYKNVIAIKEASGDLGQMITLRRLCPFLNLYCGDDGLVIPAMSIGGYGVISVLSNYKPDVVLKIIYNCKDNNYTGAFKLYEKFDEFIKLLFSETNPVPIKYVLSNTKLIKTDDVRLPLVKMQSEDYKKKLDEFIYE
jgi:4-hydroxy-tetrahydrodipicolinate synthase